MNVIITKIIKTVLPKKIFIFFKTKKKKVLVYLNLLNGYIYDLARYYKFSDSYESDTSEKLIGKIIRCYHVVEKGLTMPQRRLGFGQELVISLCMDCEIFIKKYDKNNQQLEHAIGVLMEYKNLHLSEKFILGSETTSALIRIEKYAEGIEVTSQIEMRRNDYYKFVESSFPQFSNSRSSIRNFTNEDIPLPLILEVLDLVRNTPSACNRQSWRTYVYLSEIKINEILDIQGGNRGFGHMTNKLIVVTCELGVFHGQSERNQIFIDGGMYAMNLLYSLHYKQISSCILNCSNSIEKDRKLRAICNIKENEIFIAMIACGIAPEKFMIATSKRYNIENTNTIIY